MVGIGLDLVVREVIGIAFGHARVIPEQRLGVTRPAEVFVVEPKTWKVVHHGPLDDRITYERQKAKAEQEAVIARGIALEHARLDELLDPQSQEAAADVIIEHLRQGGIIERDWAYLP